VLDEDEAAMVASTYFNGFAYDLYIWTV